MAARKAAFEADIKLTKKLETKKSEKRYEWKPRQYTETVNGKKVTFDEKVLVKTKKSLNDRVLEASERSGNQVQTRFNQLGKNLRDLTGKPRKTGSSYSVKPTGELMSSVNLEPVDYAWSAQGVARGGALSAAGLSPEPAGSGLSAVADAASFAAIPLAVCDAMAVGSGAVVAASQRSQDKQNVFQSRSSADRFTEKLESGRISEMTASEPDHFLDFKSSAKKLFHPTREQSSTKKIQKNQLGRLAVVQPVSVGLSTGAAIAAYAGAVPPVAAAMGAIGAISAGIEVVEGIHEGLRSVNLHARAKLRKEAMTKILDLEAAKENTSEDEHELLKGVVASLSEHQDRVERQAEREEKYALFHTTKAGATVGPMLVLGAVGAVAAAGVVGVATLGAAIPLAVGPAVAWGIGASVRNHERVEHARGYKRDQRAMRVVSFELTREELEQKLRDGTPIEVEFQEGEYLRDEERFAGTRKMTFSRDTNPYMGFDWLASKVLDVVQKGSYDANAAWVKLLQIHDIDAVDLFAICKAASFRPEDQRLAYIQRRIAEKAELPLLMNSDLSGQPLPHPSFFIKKFENAKNKIRELKAIENPEEIELNVKKEIRAEIRAGLWKEIPELLQDDFEDDILEDYQKLIYKKISQDDRRAIEKKIEERVSEALGRETAKLIREELRNSFPGGGKEGVKAFDAVIGEFLETIKKLEETPLIKQLKLVMKVAAEEAKALARLQQEKAELENATKGENRPFEQAFRLKEIERQIEKLLQPEVSRAPRVEETKEVLAKADQLLKELEDNVRVDDLLAQIDLGRAAPRPK